MANRYWVGGTASWDGTAGTKWALTSNGPGGQAIPTSADDVFFDSASGAAVVTIASGNTGAKSINCATFTGTLTGTAAITVSGSMTLVAGMTYSHTGTVTFNGTATLTTAGKTFSGITVNGSGITVTLGDALNIGGRTVTVTSGTFSTANFNVTAANISSSNSNARTITLGSSTVTLSSNTSTALDFTTSTNLTFNADTSQITFTGANSGLVGGIGVTFYNVSFTSTSVGVRTIAGANTFNNLTLTASAGGLSQLTFSANQTISGTFTCAGASVSQRGFVYSTAVGTTRTLTVATLNANDCDFKDIAIAGGAVGTAPTRAGDCGGNSGITFPAPKTVYRVGTNTSWYGSSSWATGSGGSGSNNNLPLAQDTAIINNDTALGGTLSISEVNVGAIDCSTRTNAITLDFGGFNVWIHGSISYGSGVTVSGTVGKTFAGRGTMIYTSANKTTTFPIVIEAPGGTFKLGDNFSSTNTVTLTSGGINADVYNFTATKFQSAVDNVRSISMGSGTWTLTSDGETLSTSPWRIQNVTNLTFNGGTASILLSSNTNFGRLFYGGGQSYGKLTVGGTTSTGWTQIADANNSFVEVASVKTAAHIFQLAANQGTIGIWSIVGTTGNLATLNSNSNGVRRTFSLTKVTKKTIDYLSVKDIGVNEINRFYVGANSTNGGNNLNVYFTAAPSQAGGNMLMLLL